MNKLEILLKRNHGKIYIVNIERAQRTSGKKIKSILITKIKKIKHNYTIRKKAKQRSMKRRLKRSKKRKMLRKWKKCLERT